MRIEKIEGVYQTRYGVPVTIVATGLEHPRRVLGVEHHPDGINISNWWKSIDDLVKIPQLTDLKIDDKVMVKDYDDAEWEKRHFAEISNDGNIITFCNGKTSFTTTEKLEWDQWRLPTEDEL